MDKQNPNKIKMYALKKREGILKHVYVADGENTCTDITKRKGANTLNLKSSYDWDRNHPHLKWTKHINKQQIRKDSSESTYNDT